MITNEGTQNSFNEKDNNLNAGTKDNVSPISEPLNEFAGSSTEALSDKLGAAKIKLSDNLSVAAEKVHQTSDVAQDFLFDKSDKVNSLAHNTIEKVNHLGHRAADAIDASSGYVRDFDFAEKREQVLGTIRERPEISLAVAGAFGLAVGLLIGRALGNRR